MRVEILIKDGEEFGRIKQKNKSKEINFSTISTPFIFISTILNDFNLKGIGSFKGKIFLDIQGYVRNGNDFGKKKRWKPAKEISSSIFCLKGNEREINYLPSSFIRKQKQKILLVTRGKKGCEIWVNGIKKVIKPSKLIRNIKNAIGAGDSFFTYFIAKFLKTNNSVISAKYAIVKTSEFLSVNN